MQEMFYENLIGCKIPCKTGPDYDWDKKLQLKLLYYGFDL